VKLRIFQKGFNFRQDGPGNRLVYHLQGCNLRCPFCDTHHESGEEMTEEEIARQVAQYPAQLVVVTGGEPSLFLTNSLVEHLHALGKQVAVETNGTHLLPESVDYITCSPKFEYCDKAEVVLPRIDELKVVFDGTNDMKRYDGLKAGQRFLQPCDTGDSAHNERILQQTFDYCLAHPEWRISLQLHKILNVR